MKALVQSIPHVLVLEVKGVLCVQNARLLGSQRVQCLSGVAVQYEREWLSGPPGMPEHGLPGYSRVVACSVVGVGSQILSTVCAASLKTRTAFGDTHVRFCTEC